MRELSNTETQLVSGGFLRPILMGALRNIKLFGTDFLELSYMVGDVILATVSFDFDGAKLAMDKLYELFTKEGDTDWQDVPPGE